MQKSSLFNLIIVAALLGLLVSSYLTYTHYTEKNSICLVGQEKSCDVVLKGPYATLFFGIPNALIGILGFGLILLLSLSAKKGNKKAEKRIFWLSLIAFLFVLYLIYLVFFVIEAFCQWCFVAWVCITTIFFASTALIRK